MTWSNPTASRKSPGRSSRLAGHGRPAAHSLEMVVVGLLTVELLLGEGSSLKDRRQVVRGLLDRVRHRFHVAAAEVEHMDSLRRAGLAFAVVANDRTLCRQVLDRVLHEVESEPRASITHADTELL